MLARAPMTLLALALLVGPDARSADLPQEVSECLRRNQHHVSSRAELVFKTVGRGGDEREIRAEIHWKRFDDGATRVHLLFSDPVAVRDSALLLIEKGGRNDMFMYLPELGKVRRVTGRMVSGSVFGTDFSYEQLERVLGLAEDAAVERREDATEAGRPVLVVAHVPDPAESQFSEVVSYVDRETCVPLRVDFFEGAGELRNVLSVDPATIEKHGEAYVPRALTMRDLRDDTRTLLQLERFELDVAISPKMFSERNLAQGH